LDAITSKLGDKESRVIIILFRMELIVFLIYLMMIEQEALTLITLKEFLNNLVKL
jgi:hypothetical protein